jgi:hypothetical protein
LSFSTDPASDENILVGLGGGSILNISEASFSVNVPEVGDWSFANLKLRS